MKTIIALIIIILSFEVSADGRTRHYNNYNHNHRYINNHRHHHHNNHGNNSKIWYAVGGAVIGGILVNSFNQRSVQYTDTIALEYERGRLDRQRQEAEMARRRAYECGFTGRC